MQSLYIEILGYIAASCTTFSMLPQALRIYKTGEVQQLSLYTFSLSMIGIALWLVYGILIHNNVIVVANVISAVIFGYIFIKLLAHKFSHSTKRE